MGTFQKDGKVDLKCRDEGRLVCVETHRAADPKPQAGIARQRSLVAAVFRQRCGGDAPRLPRCLERPAVTWPRLRVRMSCWAPAPHGDLRSPSSSPSLLRSNPGNGVPLWPFWRGCVGGGHVKPLWFDRFQTHGFSENK